MKKITKFIMMVVFALMAIPFVMFAQSDSTQAVLGTDGSNIINVMISAIETKYPVIASITTLLFLLSEILAGIPSVKANSVFQLVFGVLKAIIGKKEITAVLAVVTISMLISCSRHTVPIAGINTTDTFIQTERVVYHDTIITTRGIRLSIHDTIPCKEVVYHLEKDSADLHAIVDLRNGNLTVNCKEDSLRQLVFKLTTNYIELYRQKNTTVEVQVPGPVVTKWYIPKWVWYVLAVDAIYIIWQLLAIFVFPWFSISSIFKHWFTKW